MVFLWLDRTLKVLPVCMYVGIIAYTCIYILSSRDLSFEFSTRLLLFCGCVFCSQFYSVWQYAIATHISLSTQHYFHYKRAKLNVHQLVHNPSTSATLNHPVFRREIFGILLNVLETSQTLSLLDTGNEAIFLAVIGR